ncbi:MAG: hypothetical protein ABSF09_10515 [Candidatus Bathyarchaeia archaeon]
MIRSRSQFERLKEAIDTIAEDNHLKDYHAFVYWFIGTMYEWDKTRVINCICDGTHDKGVDAVVIDDIEKHVVVIQSKYEHEGGVATIKDKDIRDSEGLLSFSESLQRRHDESQLFSWSMVGQSFPQR